MNESYDDSEFIENFQINPIGFFKGDAGFFCRQPDWGVHMYYFSMSVMFIRIKKNDISMNEYINGFEKFINSLGDNESDFKYFESNICAFYQCMIDDGENIHDIFSTDAECRNAAEEYINRISMNYKENHYYKTVRSSYPQAAINEIW